MSDMKRNFDGGKAAENTEKIGVYIHIPFCAAKCNYCDFNSHVGNSGEQTEYISALCREISVSGEKYQKPCVDSIYFGGGTPTVLPPEPLISALDAVRSAFDVDDDCEITTECNPGTVDVKYLEKLYRGGFNRLSIGMQSADDRLLKILGRIHTFDDCRECVGAAQSAGFENISGDLMFGLPNQDMHAWHESLGAAAGLGLKHISAYALKIEDGTPFAREGVKAADDDLSRNMYDMCVSFLADMGYERYEISNFAKPGFESRHNLKYWRCIGFIGFGAGAYSCRGGKRFCNIADTAAYIKSVSDKGEAAADCETLSEFDKMSEFVYLGLRTRRGISEDEFFGRFLTPIDEVFGAEIKKNIKRGTLIRNGGRLYIPNEYIYVSNAVMSDFV